MRGTWQTSSGEDSARLILGILVVVAAVLGSGAAAAVASAIVTLLIIVGCVMTVAIVGGIALLIWRARQDRPGRPMATPAIVQLPPEPRLQWEETSEPAIDAGREIHLHLNVTPDQLAAIMRHYTGENQP